MKSRHPTRVLAAFVMAAISTVVFGAGLNVIQNPDFDTDLSVWTDANNTSFWVADDYQGAADSGSAFVGVPALFESYLTQCEPVNPNTTYVLQASAKSVCGNDAELNLYWTDVDCSNSSFAGSQTISVSGRWAALSVVAKSPNLRGRATVMLRNNGGCHDNIQFDAVSLFPDVILENGFEIVTQSQ